MLILKTLTDEGIPLHNFEFQKNAVLLLTNEFFYRSFQGFHERVGCIKNTT